MDGKDRPLDDHDVRRLSALPRLLVDSLNERMLGPGDHPVGPTELAQADAMVERVLADAGKRKITIQLKILGSDDQALATKRPGETNREVFERLKREEDARRGNAPLRKEAANPSKKKAPD